LYLRLSHYTSDTYPHQDFAKNTWKCYISFIFRTLFNQSALNLNYNQSALPLLYVLSNQHYLCFNEKTIILYSDQSETFIHLNQSALTLHAFQPIKSYFAFINLLHLNPHHPLEIVKWLLRQIIDLILERESKKVKIPNVFTIIKLSQIKLYIFMMKLMINYKYEIWRHMKYTWKIQQLFSNIKTDTICKSKTNFVQLNMKFIYLIIFLFTLYI
jgi:hypothetical protein